MLATIRTFRSTLFFMSWGLAFLPTVCLAAPLTSNETASYFRLIWGLLVVLGIILIIYGIVRKRFSIFSASTSQHIKIIEIRPMMGKKALCLVEVKGQEYLLGLSGDNINHIATLPPGQESAFAKTLETAKGNPEP